MWTSIVAISLGASLGALLRWWLGAQLNNVFPTIPPGRAIPARRSGGVRAVALTEKRVNP
jgi:fluoride exporter